MYFFFFLEKNLTNRLKTCNQCLNVQLPGQQSLNYGRHLRFVEFAWLHFILIVHFRHYTNYK